MEIDGLLDDGLVDMLYRRRLAKVAELMVLAWGRDLFLNVFKDQICRNLRG